jgi:hypothetical protein
MLRNVLDDFELSKKKNPCRDHNFSLGALFWVCFSSLERKLLELVGSQRVGWKNCEKCIRNPEKCAKKSWPKNC